MKDKVSTFFSRVRAAACCSAAAVLLLAVPGCGGGTTGTGGTGSVVEGRLLDTEGTPVSSALLTVEETGDSGTTDQSGDFIIETEIPAGAVTLLVESGATKAEAVVADLPAGDQKVDLDLELNPAQKTVKVKGKRVTPRPTRTPVPTIPAPVPTIAPPTLPTALPQPGPEAATPTASPESTTSPDVTPSPGTPTATATPAPQKPTKTKFSGVIYAADPALLIGAEIGVHGKGRHSVMPDGSFDFVADAGNRNRIIVLRSGGRITRLFVTGISDRSTKVTLSLALAARANGGLRLSLLAVEILEEAGGQNSEGGAYPTPESLLP